MLIYQVGMLIEIILNNLLYYSPDIDLVLKMSNNSNSNTNLNPNLGDIIPRNRDNLDIPRIIRYLGSNIAAIFVIRPMSKAIGLTLTSAVNILADIVNNEEKANYWIDQYNFYKFNGRFRVGQGGSGPFERGTNPLDNLNNSGTSNFMPDSNFIRDLFSPVEHSIPLDTLINVHLMMILGLFVLVCCLILIYLYFCVNILIILNKDYLLNKIKHRYALMYFKYVLFKSRVEIFVISMFIISTLCFMIYILHYLIVHPIIHNCGGIVST